MPDIKILFEPQSVAVIGASASQEKIGYKIVSNILGGGYAGKVFPINPKGGEVLGLPMYKSLQEAPGDIDVAIIVLPAQLVMGAVQECAKKKAKFIPVISSGFSEIGNNKEEQAIVQFAREHGMRIIGPNIFGVYSAKTSLNATFGPSKVSRGVVAIITQSGALGIGMIGKTWVEHMGASAIISVGNKSDIDEADLLEYLVKDESTKVIMLYMEGISNGQRLIQVLRAATKVKPVVVIKSGRSKRGAIAAASHTGALAGSDDIFDDVIRQCGVMRAENFQQAINLCKFFSNVPMPKGENTLIVTNGGGIGVMATDACEKYNVKLYDNSQALKEMFGKIIQDFGSAKNPIDLTGAANPQDYNAALSVVLKNENIHAVMALYCETAVLDMNEFSRIVQKNSALCLERNKPFLVSLFGGEDADRCVDELRVKNIHAFTDVYDGVYCLGALYRYYHYIKESRDQAEEVPIDAQGITNIVEKARQDKRNFLLANEGQEVLKAAGIGFPKSAIAKNLEEAVRLSEGIGYPVVLKVVSRDILHKSDAGGVALDLNNKNEVIDAYQAILHNCRNFKPDARIDGVEVAEMVLPGVELIVGAKRDRSLGPIVMCGQGGIYVEVMHDVAFRSVPMNRREALSMIQQIKSYKLLLGVRGEEQKDLDSVIEIIMKISTIITQCESISDIEINPLVVYEQGQGSRAVDVRVMLSERQG